MGRPPKAKPVEPVSDGESSEEGDIPFKAPTKDAPRAEGDEDEDDEDDEDGSEDEYAVEEIMTHAFGDNDQTLYQVRWVGYPDPVDFTWEPEENLSNCAEELKNYYRKIGGKPQSNKQKAKKGTKRKAENGDDTPEPATKKGANGSKKKSAIAGPNTITDTSNESFEAPSGSWDSHIVEVTQIYRGVNNDLKAVVQWNSVYNNRRSTHRVKVLHQKCPLKLIGYYEGHIQFNEAIPASMEKKVDEDEDEESFQDAPSGLNRVSNNDAVDDDGDTFVKDVVTAS